MEQFSLATKSKPREFFKSFKRCMEENDLTALYEEVRPGLVRWADIFNSNDYREDVTIRSLVQLIMTDTNLHFIPLEKRIPYYKALNKKLGTTFFDDLVLVFFDLIKGDEKWFAKTPRKLIYLLSRRMKYQLFQKMRIDITKYSYYSQHEHTEIPLEDKDLGYWPAARDILIINQLQENPWYSYILHLILQGTTARDRAGLSCMDCGNFTREETPVWNLLRQML